MCRVLVLNCISAACCTFVESSVLWTCQCKKIKLSLCANIRGNEETLAFYAFSVPSARLLHHRKMKLAWWTEMNGLKLLVAADMLHTALQPGRCFSFTTPAVHWPVFTIFFFPVLWLPYFLFLGNFLPCFAAQSSQIPAWPCFVPWPSCCTFPASCALPLPPYIFRLAPQYDLREQVTASELYKVESATDNQCCASCAFAPRRFCETAQNEAPTTGYTWIAFMGGHYCHI